MGACTVTRGIVDVYPNPQPAAQVDFTAEAINRRLGTQLAGAKMVTILQSLGFEVETTGQETYRVTVPSWRNDVSYMEDLSEEVARIYGFDNIVSSTPFGSVMQGCQSERQNFIDRIKAVLTGLGMDYAFALKKKMFDLGLRVEVDDRNEKVGYKIRESQVKKIPYTLVVGDKEMESNTAAVRKYGEKDSVTMGDLLLGY